LLEQWARCFRCSEIRSGDFHSRHKRADITRDGPRFLQAQGPSPGWHHGAASFQNRAGQLTVRSRGLPTLVRKVGHIRDVPHASAIDAVATNAVTIEQGHDDPLFLLRTPHPIPAPSDFHAGRLLAVAAKGLNEPGMRVGQDLGRGDDQCDRDPQQQEKSTGHRDACCQAVFRFHAVFTRTFVQFSQSVQVVPKDEFRNPSKNASIAQPEVAFEPGRSRSRQDDNILPLPPARPAPGDCSEERLRLEQPEKACLSTQSAIQRIQALSACCDRSAQSPAPLSCVNFADRRTRAARLTYTSRGA